MSYDWAVKNVDKVVDGDTVDLTIDLGFGLTLKHRFRLVIVDTPERHEPAWSDATSFSRMWLTVHPLLRVTAYKSDSFGRYLGDVYDPLTHESLSSALLEVGYARYVK